MQKQTLATQSNSKYQNIKTNTYKKANLVGCRISLMSAWVIKHVWYCKHL